MLRRRQVNCVHERRRRRVLLDATRWKTMASSQAGKAVYVAATRQHIGKSSVCMGAVSGLQKLCKNVGFMKPVGQRHSIIRGSRVDSDVVLMQQQFQLAEDFRHMSPLVIHNKYTRELYGAGIDQDKIKGHYTRTRDLIIDAFETVQADKDFTVVEGTGHMGVGSVIGFSNAEVAKIINTPMCIVTNGGFGRMYDELHVAVAYAESVGASVNSIIVNKVRPSKLEEVQHFLQSSFIAQTGISCAGVIPYGQMLDSPTLKDFEDLFATKLLAGFAHRFDHYHDIQIVATGLRRFIEKLDTGLYNNAAFVTHASRADICLGFMSHSRVYQAETGKPFPAALIVAGADTGVAGGGNIKKEFPHVMAAIKLSDAPVLYVEKTVAEVVHELTNNVAKLVADDTERSNAAIDLYENHIDFEKFMG